MPRSSPYPEEAGRLNAARMRARLADRFEAEAAETGRSVEECRRDYYVRNGGRSGATRTIQAIEAKIDKLLEAPPLTEAQIARLRAAFERVGGES